MQYVGIDWAYRRAAWCAKQVDGTIFGEGFVPADEDGVARLVIELGPEVRACLEMMSGAVWVRDRLAGAGWQVEVADARKVKNVAPLACKTDKVDARVLAELCRRELVPALWIPSLEERALRERLKRRLPPRPPQDLGQEPRLRPAHPMGPQDPVRSPAPTRRDGAARDARCARGLAPLRGRGARGDRAARRADRSARPRAGAARPRRPRVSLLSTIPGIGPPARADDRRRDRRRRPLPWPAQADRLLRPRAGGSSSRASARARASYRRPARARCASPPSRRPRAPGARRTLGTTSTRTSRRGPARRTRPSRRSPARFSSPAGTCLAAKSPSSPAARAVILSRQAPSAFWPPDGPHAN
jgi:transposase